MSIHKTLPPKRSEKAAGEQVGGGGLDSRKPCRTQGVDDNEDDKTTTLTTRITKTTTMQTTTTSRTATIMYLEHGHRECLQK